jgi:putative ABC transport system ATP-binding protein
MYAIEVEGVSKSFGVGQSEVTVLHGISARLSLGDLTMITGPSGCGKTTLISILSGILSPSHGEVRLFGHSLYAMRDTERVLFRRAQVGFIFQQYNLLPALTALENVSLPLYAAGVSAADAHTRAAQVLDTLEMSPHAQKLPRQLSGGQQQRVAIGRALIHGPRLIVCDEPTAALDAHTGRAVMVLLHAAARQSDRAVVVVTHDNRIYEFADRMLHMDDGRIVSDSHMKSSGEEKE